MADFVGITAATAVAQNSGDLNVRDINVNNGFEAVTPHEGGSITTSVPAEISANGFNLPGAAQQHLIDPNQAGLANPGGTSFGGYSLSSGAGASRPGNGAAMDNGLGC